MKQISKKLSLYALAFTLPLLISMPVMAISAIGNLDPDFNAGGSTPGTVVTPVGSGGDNARAVALQADGKILVAGSADSDFALVRYNADGSLDTTFNGTGIVTTDFSSFSDSAVGVVVQSDGKIVLAGTAYNGSDNDFALARYNADGSLDTGFGTDGKIMTDFGLTSDHAGDLALQPDGKLVVSGYRDVGGGEFEYALARYDTDGSLDVGFGTEGKVSTALGTNNDWTVYLTIQPDGKIVAAGLNYTGATSDFVLIRFDPDGTAESAAIPSIGTLSDIANALALQSDGGLVAAGDADNDFVVVRYISTDAPWDLTPDAFSFTDESDVPIGSQQTSDMITVSGLDVGARVPVTVSGGEYAKNGSSSYTTDPGWVQNGDTLNVRHTAASGGGQTTDTTLGVGGIMAGDNLALILGAAIVDAFSSTTASGGGSSSGLFDLLSLAVLAMGGWFRWRRRRC